MSLLDKASLVQIPSGYKATKLYSVVPAPKYGSELAVNGDFDTDSDWTKGGGWSIVNGEAVHTGSGDYIEQGSLVQGTKYRVVIVVTQASGSGFTQIYMGGLTTAMTSPNTYTFDITAQSGDKIKLRGLNDCKVDSISVKEVLVADGDFTFARSSTGSRVGSDGLIETGVAIDTPRLDYSGGASCPTLLLEPQSTNLVKQSEDMSSSIYGKSNVTFTGQTTTAPDGNQAEFLTVDGYIFLNMSAIGGTAPTTTRTFSFYVKAQSVGYEIIYRKPDGTTILTNVSHTEWTRIEATSLSTSNNIMLTDNRVIQSVGNVAFWGVQMEDQSYATSYIPTSGSTTTRTADVCNNAGTSATFNDAEGVLFAEIASLSNVGVANRSISISDGTNTNQIVLRFSVTANQILAYITDGGVITAQLTHTLTNALIYNKIGLKYKVNDVALWVNGTEVATDTNATMPSGFDELKFSRGDGINKFYGKTKQLIYFNEALTDTELTALTTI